MSITLNKTEVKKGQKGWFNDRWHTDDILSIRPDLTIDQANEVLLTYLNRDKSDTYEVLDYIAADLFPTDDEE